MELFLRVITVSPLPLPHGISFGLVHPQRHEFQIDGDMVQLRGHSEGNNMIHRKLIACIRSPGDGG